MAKRSCCASSTARRSSSTTPKLGLPPTIIDQFKAALALPNGIVLVTGPTGSGKTTTLYTGLLALNSIERKIMTVEDPIEFRLHGITQMQVHEQIGLTFEELLSAIVRQDPNVIMVGEIRNRETAQIAAQRGADSAISCCRRCTRIRPPPR